MKKKILLTFALLVSSIQSFALYHDSPYANCCSDTFGFDAVLTFDVGGGYRQDDLKWKNYPVDQPGTQITEKWKKLEVAVFEMNSQFLACEHYLLKFDFDYAWFDKAGKQQVSFYDPEGSLSQKLAAETKGRVYDVSGGLGYQFNFFDYRYSFAPLVGYSYHFQKFTNKHYHDKLNNAAADLDIDNIYKYRWRGAWLGFCTAYQITSVWQVNFGYAYHWLRYRGKIHQEFFANQATIEQKASNGQGNEFIASTTYEFCNDWFLTFKLDYKIFSAHKGENKQGNIPSDNVEAISVLHGVKWTTFNATMDIGYIF